MKFSINKKIQLEQNVKNNTKLPSFWTPQLIKRLFFLHIEKVTIGSSKFFLNDYMLDIYAIDKKTQLCSMKHHLNR